MKENSNIILTFLDEGISRIKINDTSNYNALSSKNISSLIDIFKSLNSDNKTSNSKKETLNHITINKLNKLNEIISEIKNLGFVSIDTETNSLDVENISSTY